ASYNANLVRARWRAAHRRWLDVESLDDGGPDLVSPREGGAAQREAAVDGDHLAGHVGVGFEEQPHDLCHVFGPAEAAYDSTLDVTGVLAGVDRGAGHGRSR